MLIVGCETRRSRETAHDSSPIQRCVLSAFFAEASLRFGIASARIFFELWTQGLHLVEEALDRRGVTVRLHQRVESLHETPGRAVDLSGQARMDILRRPPTPFLAARDDLHLDDALGPEVHLDAAVRVLAAERDDDCPRTCAAPLRLRA